MAKTKSKRHYYSPEFKRDAVQRVEQGDQPLAAVARTLVPEIKSIPEIEKTYSGQSWRIGPITQV
jgi:hypothetical protein